MASHQGSLTISRTPCPLLFIVANISHTLNDKVSYVSADKQCDSRQNKPGPYDTPLHGVDGGWMAIDNRVLLYALQSPSSSNPFFLLHCSTWLCTYYTHQQRHSNKRNPPHTHPPPLQSDILRQQRGEFTNSDLIIKMRRQW